MKEILFRGKRVDTIGNGEWIEGYYAAEPYVENTYNRGYILENEKDLYAKKAYFVDSRTVGQYTGLTDKSGKKIFEGDILSIAQKGNGIGDYFYPPLKYPSNAIVKWDKCSWMWEIIAEQRYYLTFTDAWCHFECKIIGNIHDNPELLEVEK